MNRIYCNKCNKDVTNEPYLSVGTDWNNTKYLEKYEPRGIHLCEEHAMEFIESTKDEGDFKRYLDYKRDYERERADPLPAEEATMPSHSVSY